MAVRVALAVVEQAGITEAPVTLLFTVVVVAVPEDKRVAAPEEMVTKASS
jgi:hypothetical protein